MCTCTEEKQCLQCFINENDVAPEVRSPNKQNIYLTIRTYDGELSKQRRYKVKEELMKQGFTRSQANEYIQSKFSNTYKRKVVGPMQDEETKNFIDEHFPILKDALLERYKELLTRNLMVLKEEADQIKTELTWIQSQKE